MIIIFDLAKTTLAESASVYTYMYKYHGEGIMIASGISVDASSSEMQAMRYCKNIVYLASHKLEDSLG